MASLDFKLEASDKAARATSFLTSRGLVQTPIFMPVGTAGTVKALTMDMVAQSGATIVLGNTYHLMLRPGPERLKNLGGLHEFMMWNGPILTDSGGFQVMSLSKIVKITEEAVTFSSHIDGSKHVLTPEKSIYIQADMIGADISMQLDECVAYPCSKDEARKAMERSIRWAARSKTTFGHRDHQFLFGIQQGSVHEDLRSESSQRLIDLNFDGYAIGGLAVGEGHDAMKATLIHCVAHLPVHRPRYLMGVGKPIDMLVAIQNGVDMFDCVLPTRSGRHGQAYCWDGAINLKNARFAEDKSPLDPLSNVPASSQYSKAYLHHLVKSQEILGQIILSWHNISFFQDLMKKARQAIIEQRYDDFVNSCQIRWQKGEPN
jgi:queuine tRNA-ribosyltransferase